MLQNTLTPTELKASRVESRRRISPTLRSKLATISVSAVALFGANSAFDTAPAYGQADCISYSDGNGTLKIVCDQPEGQSSDPVVPEAEEQQPEPTIKPKRRPARASQSSERYFPGYEMGASSFTDGNGCFVTSAASALRRATGDETITPQSVYKGKAITSRWSPGGGVRGYLFDALPSMAQRFGIKVKKTGFKGVIEALNSGGQAMVLFDIGRFTNQGHYMAIRKSLPNGRVVLDDPNGEGMQGDSERSKGWNASELKAGGAIAYRTLIRRR